MLMSGSIIDSALKLVVGLGMCRAGERRVIALEPYLVVGESG